MLHLVQLGTHGSMTMRKVVTYRLLFNDVLLSVTKDTKARANLTSSPHCTHT